MFASIGLIQINLSLVMRKCVFGSLRRACTATEASLSLEISTIESRDIILSKQRTTKALIRLCGCAGWSVPLLSAYEIRHIFSWPSSFKYDKWAVFNQVFRQKCLAKQCRPRSDFSWRVYTVILSASFEHIIKIQKNSDTWTFAVITLKYEQGGITVQ